MYLVDMLDCLDYVTFDSGPGQMMLRAVKFFNEYDPKKVKPLDIKQKAQRLMDLYEDGERRLKANREKDLARYRHEFGIFMAGKDFSVTPATQRSLQSRMSVARFARDRKRQLGQYLTPDSTAAAIVRDLHVSPRSRIMEPSFGEGAFLFQIVDHLKTEIPENKLSSWCETHLFGCEIDEKAYKKVVRTWQSRGLGTSSQQP